MSSSVKKGASESPGSTGSSSTGSSSIGASSTMDPKDMEKVSFLLDYAMKDSSFRKGITHDPAGTIEIYRSKLGFGTPELSEEVLDVIGSFTDDELKMMYEIKQKLSAKMGGEEAMAANGGGYAGSVMF